MTTYKIYFEIYKAKKVVCSKVIKVGSDKNIDDAYKNVSAICGKFDSISDVFFGTKYAHDTHIKTLATEGELSHILRVVFKTDKTEEKNYV